MISFLCLKMSAEGQCERSRGAEKPYPRFPRVLRLWGEEEEEVGVL